MTITGVVDPAATPGRGFPVHNTEKGDSRRNRCQVATRIANTLDTSSGNPGFRTGADT
ncbi:hypothetical protein [Amycolatopsis sp. SID8362]|uniref:hypothetical protein n=1 Tax=Amycolatopsis sp. SID8362 TaxID=2690346 RepID=UPI00136B7EB7|nr:hypothetical protein [Amycolatopsis sp. SID8362]NBH02900.1 hypothetical protein [Amycolatopsis sp. SID8362]NED39601.1 hypothetical protein [Amycolatopsis sp. SID8362]